MWFLSFITIYGIIFCVRYYSRSQVIEEEIEDTITETSSNSDNNINDIRDITYIS